MAEQQQKSDNTSLWAQRWDKKETGWHMNQLNPAIATYGEQWLRRDVKGEPIADDAEPLSILFPLSGKSLDLPILASQGYHTFGIEGVQQAIDEYQADNNVVAKELAPLSKDLKVLELQPNVTVFLGDFFSWGTDPTVNYPSFDRIFDRGSLVAILPEKRDEYINIMHKVLKNGGKWLIASMEYPQDQKPGAPHSIGENDVAGICSVLNQRYPHSVYKYEVLAKLDSSAENFPTNSRFLKKNGGPLDYFVDYVIMVTKVQNE